MTGASEPFEIAAGRIVLGVAPEVGGSLAYLKAEGRDLLRAASATALAAKDPLGMGCFPMLPYCNRVIDAAFDFGGARRRLALNFGDHPHAIHGNAWRRPWTVVRREAAACILGLRHEAPDANWPFPYRATQILAVDEVGLTVEIAVRNEGKGAMPLGFGLHPYFAKTPGMTLKTATQGVWRNDARMAPVALDPVPPGLDFSEAKRLADIEVDNGFAGWSGRAELRWPELGLGLDIDADPLFGHVVIYAPPGGDFVCVEPASNANDGFNKMASGDTTTGVRVLEPGAILAGRLRFDVVKIPGEKS